MHIQNKYQINNYISSWQSYIIHIKQQKRHMIHTCKIESYIVSKAPLFVINRKCPLRGHILAPLEGVAACPRATRGQPQESGGDSKAI